MGDDVGRWLEGLGLGRYAAAFAENDIDFEVLPDLTERDLEQLGVSLGHRKRLLRAIAARPPAPATPPAAAPVEAPPRPTAGAVPAEAERRQLTVLFCDLVGSTELASRLDPEDLREVIAAYHGRAAEVVERYDGRVSKFMGDGVLAQFGHPRAHEDDAERAVRAGLDLVEAVGALAVPRGGGAKLRVRVGVATGVVVVGDLFGPEDEREQAVVGRTPNLAERLQTLAEPDSVVISRRTRRLVGGLFDLVDLGERAVPGFAEPVRVWRVLGPSAAEDRFEAREAAAGLTPLVGREHELGLLLARWELARAGEGQVVLLAGEPGIGKSRLVQALRARLDDEPHLRLHHACSPFHAGSALHPVIDQIGRAAGLRRDDPPGRKLDKLEALLARSTDDVAAVAPLVADLLAIPAAGRYPPLDLSPERRRERLFAALLAQLDGLAARRPVLHVFDDVHWIDPTSLELLGLAVDRVQRLPVLTVVTFRPEFRPPWTGRSHVTLLTLSRLGRREVAALVGHVGGGKALPPPVAEQIAAKTDGVPLFVEELTKTVLESGLLRDAGDRYELTGPLPPLAIPATLQDSLTARLDRLAPLKDVAQVAAAIGREFPHDLLAAVAPLGGDALDRALDRLVEAELVFRRGTPPEATYSFKHALVQDAAYQSLLLSRRQQLHARIAAALEERFPEQREEQPELLAHHLTAAGLTDKAIGYWREAGRRAVARSAAVEAAAHFTKALDLLGRDAAAVARPEEIELELHLALGGALIAAKGFAAPETGRCYRRARELSRRTGDMRHLLTALLGEYTYRLLRAELDPAQAIAEEMLAIARERGDDDVVPRLMAHRALGTNAFALGRFGAARDHLERVLALYDPRVHRPLTLLSGYDIRVPVRGYLCLVLFILGHPDRARAAFHRVLAETRRLRHLYSVCHGLHYACTMHKFFHDTDGAREAAEALLAVATEQGFPMWTALAGVNRGWARAVAAAAVAEGDEAEAGIEEVRRGLAAYRATGAEYLLTHFTGMLAEAIGATGRTDEALEVLGEALAQVERTGERCLEAELHRLRGGLLLAHSPAAADEAEAALRRALALAREQDARMWELRAATGLARLWRDHQRPAEARDLLAPVCARFSEGFDTADLRNARALLAELA